MDVTEIYWQRYAPGAWGTLGFSMNGTNTDWDRYRIINRFPFADVERAKFLHIAAEATPHAVALSEGKRREYGSLVKCAQKTSGWFLAAYDGGWVAWGRVAKGQALPALISTVINADGTAVSTTPDSVMQAQSAAPTQAMKESAAAKKHFSQARIFDRLGPWRWKCLPFNENDTVDFRPHIAGADKEFLIKVLTSANDPQNNVELENFLCARNETRSRPTRELLFEAWDNLPGNSSGWKEGRTLLSSYLGALVSSANCPADWSGRPAEAWYEHISSLIEQTAFKPDETAEFFMSTVPGKIALVANPNGNTSPDDLLLNAYNALVGSWSMKRLFCQGLLGKLKNIPRDFSAAMPWEKFSRLTAEDFTRMFVGKRLRDDMNINHRSLPERPDLDILRTGGGRTTLTEAISTLSDSNLWNQQPWRRELLKATIN